LLIIIFGLTDISSDGVLHEDHDGNNHLGFGKDFSHKLTTFLCHYIVSLYTRFHSCYSNITHSVAFLKHNKLLPVATRCQY